MIRFLVKKAEIRNISLPEMVAVVIRFLRGNAINLETTLKSRRRDERIQFLSDEIRGAEEDLRIVVSVMTFFNSILFICNWY